MRLARPIVLNPESRRQLERQARGRTVPMRVALRSRIVLLAADGKQHKQISEELKISPRTCLFGIFLPRAKGCPIQPRTFQCSSPRPASIWATKARGPGASSLAYTITGWWGITSTTILPSANSTLWTLRP